MAEPGFPSSDSPIASAASDDGFSPPRLPAAPQPPSHDWEVLSMSTMSASILGLPRQHASESEQTDDLADEVKKSEGLGLEAMAGSQSSIPSGYGEGTTASRPFDIEPFTEGWRPHLRATSAGAPFQENHPEEVYVYEQEEVQEETFSPDEEDMEPLVGRHEELVAAEETAERSISPALDVVDADAGNPPKKKACKVSWWKCQTVLWQPQSRKSSAVWSIVLVAAVVGIAVIGHRWHRERYQNQQLRLELSSKDEKLNDLMYQVNRMKEAMTGRRRVGVNRNSFF